MLWTGGPSLTLGTNNIGATYTDTGIGTAVATSASANTKGSNVNLVNGLAAEAYGLSIFVSGVSTSAAIRRLMIDILIDYAAGAGNAGSSWSVLIANLYFNSPTFGLTGGGGNYYFPVIIPRGAALGAAAQGSTGGVSPRVVLGVPTFNSRPEGANYGTQVQTIGATTGTTTGVAITPGTNVKGSYTASLGTLTRDSFWFQLGVGSAATTMTANGYFFDLAAGPSQEKMCIYDMMYGVVGAAEQAYMSWGQMLSQRLVPSGSNLYARAAACGSAPDSTMTVVAYAVS